MLKTRHMIRVLLGSLTTMSFSACADRTLSEPDSTKTATAPPLLEIVDGAHNGRNHFYFLPPLAPQPTVSGIADASLSPLVSVCEWDGSTCGTVVAEFNTSAGTGSHPIAYDAGNQQYSVNWDTSDCVWGACSLDATKVYRLQVSVGPFELGHMDLRVRTQEIRKKDADGSDMLVVAGRTLPIRFRVERGIPATIAITPDPAVVDLGSYRQLSAIIRDLGGNVISAPVSWSSKNQSTATVNSSGLLTGVMGGCTTVTAAFDGIQGNAHVRVTPIKADLVFYARYQPPAYTLAPRVFAGRVDGCIAPYQLSSSAVRDAEPAVVSPDGSRVAFIGDLGRIHIVGINGSGEQIIVPSGLSLGGYASLSWSSDGSRLAFVGLFQQEFGGSLRYSREVFTIRADGTDLRQITLFEPPPPDAFGGSRNYVNEVRWSPIDGTLAFLRAEDWNVNNVVTNRTAVYRINADGSGLALLAGIGANISPGTLRWLPGGYAVTYVDAPDFSIWTIGVTGAGRTMVRAPGRQIQGGNTVSPNGAEIAFIATSENCPFGSVLFVSVSGSSESSLPCDAADRTFVSAQMPAWSRDGSEVLYARTTALINGAQPFELFATKRDGSATRFIGSGYRPVVIH